MTAPKDGGAAFPRDAWITGSSEGGVLSPQMGMSLRDYFAAQALGTVIPHIIATMAVKFSEKEMAGAAYAIADAMLRARRDGGGE